MSDRIDVQEGRQLMDAHAALPAGTNYGLDAQDAVEGWFWANADALLDAAAERDALAEQVARLEAQVEDWREALTRAGETLTQIAAFFAESGDQPSRMATVSDVARVAEALARYPAAPSDPVRVPEDSGEGGR